ncbi:MAG: hypothetical protein M3246_04955 [Actinomycetota bacterium]|nr:hypothetical protein [Actinomycetota bacterium]
MPDNASLHPAAKDYGAKTSYEAARLARPEHTGLLQPFGDPLSGIVLIAEGATDEAASAPLTDALRRSLAAVELDRAYVTWYPPVLLEEILSLEPCALVAVGPGAARAIDSLDYPLAKTGFSEAPEGSWFAWTKGTSGLRLPALAPALGDADAKRRFWRAFLALRALAPDKEPGSRP